MKRAFVCQSAFLSVLALVVASSQARAACVSANEPVTVTGVALSRAAYVDPQDFGWAPPTGYQPYVVVVSQDPVCVVEKSPEGGGDVEIRTHVVQVSGLDALSDAALKNGVRVTVRGQAFAAHTAHNFEDLVLAADSVQLTKP